MKAKILTKKEGEKKSIELPKNFSSEIRKDIVLKVFEAQKRQQAYGTKPGAGASYSASGISIKARHRWKGTYGKGISRIPRKIMSRHGSSFNWVGATTANTRGGRAAHPPRTEKNQFKKINKKELIVAMNSCFSASVNNKMLSEHYKKEILNIPLVISDEILKMKTKEFLDFFKKALGEAYENALKKKTRRCGRGKTRGRKYRLSSGILFVIGKNEEMKRKGVDIVNVDDLEVADLTLNGVPARLVVYTENAIKEIQEKWKK
jgi:large subunit ribosomal protein L4e